MDSDSDQDEGPTRGEYSKKYTKEDLRTAIEKIKNNEISYGAASKTYNVPKTTLFNKMRNDHNNRRGATTVLTKDQENELADWILLHQKYGDPRTKHDMVIAAGEIANLDEDSSKHFKNGNPTSGWVEGFLKRHPIIVSRTPEAISKASAINTKEDFSKLWRNIHDYFQSTNRIDLLHKPEHWWNADETNFPKDPISKKVLARKGSKNVHRRERGAPKDNTTVTYAFSADGDHIEPLITFKNSTSSLADICYALGGTFIHSFSRILSHILWMSHIANMYPLIYLSFQLPELTSV